MCLHTLPRLPRPTVNDLPPYQHEKVSFVCACTEPPGLELVPCALSAVDKRGRKKMLNHDGIHKHTHKHTNTHSKHTQRQKNSNQGTLPSCASRYEVLLWKTKKKGSRFALTRLILNFLHIPSVQACPRFNTSLQTPDFLRSALVQPSTHTQTMKEVRHMLGKPFLTLQQKNIEEITGNRLSKLRTAVAAKTGNEK